MNDRHRIMRAIFPVLLLFIIINIFFVSFQVCAYDIEPGGLYNQIFMPIGNLTVKYSIFRGYGFKTWSFSPLPTAWPATIYMVEPGTYYDQNIAFFLLRSQFKYSYRPLYGLYSSRFYQTLIFALTPDDKYNFSVFSTLGLNKVQFKSDYIYLVFEGKITPNLTYNINFDLNTDGIYVDPTRLGNLNDISIPDSTLTLRYYFH
jgi:hypothetical protein